MLIMSILISTQNKKTLCLSKGIRSGRVLGLTTGDKLPPVKKPLALAGCNPRCNQKLASNQQFYRLTNQGCKDD